MAAKAKTARKAAKKRSTKPTPHQKLAHYRSKRDFSVTAEPSGAASVQKSPHLRFVIQKHAATRLHYDLRLELDGVFRSWAVTKGPSLDPKDKRLAVEVEDHPLDYGDFEGTIPKGEYGGGTVMLWDRGFWMPAPGVDPQTALRKGELKFVLSGEKLNGGFVLVRMARRENEKRDNWLLIKHRDEYAVEDDEAAIDDAHSVASKRTMEQIAAGKGRKPAPFMLKKATAADAVWRSNRPSK
jgi:bifunctional non-homologous end joining protein LigD